MIPSMTSTALAALTEAMKQNVYSDKDWEHECTNHPYRLIGTSGFRIVADGKGDFEVGIYFGQTKKGSVIRMDLPIEKIDTGYEGQSLKEGYVYLQSYKHPTWTWAYGGISVLLDDTNAEEDEDGGVCECIPQIDEPKTDTISNQRSLEAWLA